MLKKSAFLYLLLAGLSCSFVACDSDDDDPQVTDTSSLTMSATVTGGQEVPAVITSADGQFRATYNRGSRVLIYHLTYTGLIPTASHIHAGAPGVVGGVLVPFTAGPSPITGVVTLSQADGDKLAAGPLYVNVHTDANPTGEIRGNINLNDTTSVLLSADLTGDQEVPAVTTTATGDFLASYNKNTRLLRYELTYSGLMPTASHIHFGVPTATGDVLIPFVVTPSPIAGSRTLTQAEADKLMGGATYVNVHTTANPKGEIRGNLVVE